MISQSTGAMDEVRDKLQSKEDMIVKLEKRLRHQSATGTLRLSPSHSLLLKSKASPLRDILLTGPYLSNKVRAVRDANKEFNFKSPTPETARSSSRYTETPEKTLTPSACYGDSSIATSNLLASPFIDYKCAGGSGRTNTEHSIVSKQDGPEANISYIEPVMASTMLGQSMFEASPAQGSGQKHVSFVNSKKAFSKNVPFRSYAASPKYRTRKRSISGPASSRISECAENSEYWAQGVPFSRYDGESSLVKTLTEDKENGVTRNVNTPTETMSILKKTRKDLPFEHPLTPVTSPKYMDVFKEQMVQKKLSKSSMNSTLNTSSMSSSTTTHNRSKIASLVEKFETSSRSNASTKSRPIRRRSKTYRKGSPVSQKRGPAGVQARGNKASELRMKAKLRSASKSKNGSGDSVLFSIGKF